MATTALKHILDWKIFYGSVLFFIMALMLFYIFGINELTGGAYFIKNYEKQISALSLKNKDLQVELAKTGFLGNLEAKTRELSFEKTKTVKYIQMQGSDNHIVTAK